MLDGGPNLLEEPDRPSLSDLEVVATVEHRRGLGVNFLRDEENVGGEVDAFNNLGGILRSVLVGIEAVSVSDGVRVVPGDVLSELEADLGGGGKLEFV